MPFGNLQRPKTENSEKSRPSLFRAPRWSTSSYAATTITFAELQTAFPQNPTKTLSPHYKKPHFLPILPRIPKMAFSSAPKAALKLFNISAPSIQTLLRPAAAAATATATQLFQSPASTATISAAADPRLFNLPQPEIDRSDSARTLNLREIGFALNSLAPPFGYSAARKPTNIDLDEDNFTGEDDDDDSDYSPDFDDIDVDSEDDDEEDEESAEEEAPRR